MNNKILSFCLTIFGLIMFSFFAIHFLNEENAKYVFNDSHHRYVIAQGKTLIGFDLVDPEEAPSKIVDSVMRGYRIIMNTPLYAPKYARDQLSCTSCHFSGGDTLGGRGNGISLVGVTTTYPRYSEREGKVISLEERINSCFEKSMNGHPLPIDSQEMKDVVSYLNWISKEVKNVKHIPWLGLSKFKMAHRPNAEDGENKYNIHCAQCHKQDGQGGGVLANSQGKTIPPLWGSNSFNDAAGMSLLPKLSAFIFFNMPLGTEGLTEEEAIDIAAFVLKQPRPHFEDRVIEN